MEGLLPVEPLLPSTMRAGRLLSAAVATSSRILQTTTYASSSSAGSTTCYAWNTRRRPFHSSLSRRQDDRDEDRSSAQVTDDGASTSSQTPAPGKDAYDTPRESSTDAETGTANSQAPSQPISDEQASRLNSLFGLGDDSPASSSSSSEKKITRSPFSLSPNESVSSSSSSNAASAYDGLFDSPDAFARADPPSARSSARKVLPRETLLGGSAQRQGFRGAGYDSNSRGDRYAAPAKLDPSEKRKWQKLLADVASSFSSDGRGGSGSALDGALGSFARRNDLEDLRQNRRRARLGHRATVSDGSGRLARLDEGIGSDLSEEDIEAGVDQARQEMNLQMNEADLWAWAAKEIWAFDEKRHRKGSAAARQKMQPPAETPAEAGEEAGTATATAKEEEEPVLYQAAYGMGTPFYGPVLHQLLIHFRDRLKSPTSALAVLQITRALGPRSLVLGCTAELYTEAIRTRWEEWRDARGCLELLKEARGVGIVDSRIARGLAGPEPNSRSLVGVGQSIQAELRQSVLAGRARDAESKVDEELYRSLGQDDHEDFGKPERETATDSLTALWPSSVSQVADAPPPKAIGAETLSLAAIQALHMADDIGRIIGSDRRRQSDQRNMRGGSDGREGEGGGDSRGSRFSSFSSQGGGSGNGYGERRTFGSGGGGGGAGARGGYQRRDGEGRRAWGDAGGGGGGGSGSFAQQAQHSSSRGPRWNVRR